MTAQKLPLSRKSATNPTTSLISPGYLGFKEESLHKPRISRQYTLWNAITPKLSSSQALGDLGEYDARLHLAHIEEKDP